MIGILIAFIFIAMILVAFFTITEKSLTDSIVLFMSLSLGNVILFFIFKAPDVALTEAVISAGIGSLIFLMALKHLGVKQ